MRRIIIEADWILTKQQVDHISEQFKRWENEGGVLLLYPGLKLVSHEKDDETDDEVTMEEHDRLRKDLVGLLKCYAGLGENECLTENEDEEDR